MAKTGNRKSRAHLSPRENKSAVINWGEARCLFYGAECNPINYLDFRPVKEIPEGRGISEQMHGETRLAKFIILLDFLLLPAFNY